MVEVVVTFTLGSGVSSGLVFVVAPQVHPEGSESGVSQRMLQRGESPLECVFKFINPFLIALLSKISPGPLLRSSFCARRMVLVFGTLANVLQAEPVGLLLLSWDGRGCDDEGRGDHGEREPGSGHDDDDSTFYSLPCCCYVIAVSSATD